jgi:CRP-like cAMP-binding protein
VAHDDIHEVIRNHLAIAYAFWRDTLIDAAVFREWMVGIGRRTAYQRIAHLFCELMVRYKAIGLTTDHQFELSATQAEIADALGLSTVHVNRTLQELREAGLITLKGGLLKVLEWEGLKQAGEFDPTYLHLEKREIA